MTQQIYRLPDVKARTGLCRSAIYQQISQGIFPKQIYLGPRTVGWTKTDIDEWIDQKIREAK